MLKRIFDVVGWLGMTLVLAAAVARFVKPEVQPLWYWLAVSGLACVAVYLLSQWREIARMFARRQARYGSLAFVSVLLVLGTLVAINYVAARRNARWDLTAAKQFTLSDQTRRVLQSLKEPIKVLVFAREDDFERFRSLLTEYENAADRRVSVEYVDADKKPAQARQYQIQSYGTVVFDYQGRVERVVGDSEQELTNTLIKAVEGKQRKVYFVQGHGEKDTRSSERDGYKTVADALASDNYAVETLVLAQQGEVPSEASVVAVAGPKTDLLPPEIEALRRYLRKGGKLFFLLDPPEKPDAPALTNVETLLKDWAIEVGNNVVVDVSGVGQLFGAGIEVPVSASYPSHPITERFSLLTAFPLTRSVSPVSGGVEGHFAQSFVETSPRSWAESDVRGLLSTGKAALEENKGDRSGPIGIAAAVSATAPDAPAQASSNEDVKKAGQSEERRPETRLAVVGDSDFAANFALGIQGNRDLFLNIVSWLAQQENLIAIRPREPEDRRVTLTADQQRRIFWLSVVIIPGLVLVAGTLAWWRRR